MRASNEFRAWLSEQMETRGMTNADLSRALDIPDSTVSRVLRGVGKSVSEKTARRIADVFGIDIYDLYAIADGRPVQSMRESSAPGFGSGDPELEEALHWLASDASEEARKAVREFLAFTKSREQKP